MSSCITQPLDDKADAALTAMPSKSLAEARDEDPRPAYRASRAARASASRRRGLVRLCQTLCGGPRSQNDYLELATQFHTLILSNVPEMPVRLASEARRFTWLVDVLYDRRVKLIISAAVPPDQLYTDGPLAHEFPRTVSRLQEMQSQGIPVAGTARSRYLSDLRA